MNLRFLGASLVLAVALAGVGGCKHCTSNRCPAPACAAPCPTPCPTGGCPTAIVPGP